MQQWSRDQSVDAYLDALNGVLDVARSLRPQEWTLGTDLPAWTVFDVVAHVAAVEDELAGRPVPSSIHDWSAFPYAQTHFQQYTEIGVEHRRRTPPAELLDELAALVDERTRQLANTPEAPDAEMRGPAGLVGPVARMMGTRVLDIWAHEQDIRRATGRPIRMSGPAADAGLVRMVEALPIVVARQAQAPPGTAVRFVVPGDLDATVRVDDAGQGVLDASAVPAVTLTMGREALQLLFCGRKPQESVPVEVDGDQALAERLKSALAVTP